MKVFMFNEQTPVAEVADILRGAPQEAGDGWRGWKNVQQAHIQLLEELVKNTKPYVDGTYTGKGIVSSVNAKPGMSSGKNLAHGYFPGAWCMVKELRRLGCDLPVTFTYMGDNELDPFLISLVKKHLNVDCIDLLERNKTDPMRILAGWESKVYGVIQAPYEQVLYLDADCLPILNPEYLFDSPQIKYHGAILWPDMPPYDRTEWLRPICWENVGLPPRTDYVDAESGQLIIDKKKWHEELQSTRWLNEHSDWVFRFVFGDKSTFVLGSAKVQHMLGKNGHAMPSKMCGWDGANITQYGFDGSYLFQHGCQNKCTLHGYPHPHTLHHRGHVESHLAELRTLWDGTMWENHNPSQDEQGIMNELMTSKWEYRREGIDKRPLSFVADNRIGKGLAKKEVTWSVFCRGITPKLVVKDIDGGVTLTAEKRNNGDWAGQWLCNERCPVKFTKVTS